MPINRKKKKKKNTLRSYSPEPRKPWDWTLLYNIERLMSTKFVQMMKLGWPLTFDRYGPIYVLVAVAILIECCMAFADMTLLFYPASELWPMISQGAFCRKDVDNVFKWFCTNEEDGCHAQIVKKFVYRSKKALRPNLCMQHPGLKVYQVSSNDETRMTFDLLRYGQICVPVAKAILEQCCMAFADIQLLLYQVSESLPMSFLFCVFTLLFGVIDRLYSWMSSLPSFIGGGGAG